MHTATVVVFAEGERTRLLEGVFAAGLPVLVRTTLESFLDMLRRERPLAVVVDAGVVDSDALEVVLNIRDIDDEVPVCVVGEMSTEEECRVLRSLENTLHLHGPDASDIVASRLADLLDGNGTPRQAQGRIG